MNSFLFLNYLAFWKPLGYTIIFLGMILEGDFMLFAAGFLTHQRILDPGDTLIFVMSGVFLGDILWYLLGYRLNGSSFFVARWFGNIAKSLDNHIIQRPFHIIFLSKFTYGLHHAVLLRAGMLKLSFKQFLRIDLLASLPWIVLVGGLGWGAGASFLLLKRYLRVGEIVLLIAILVFLAISYFVSHRLREKIVR